MIMAAVAMTSCASPGGKVVSVERLARFEGGGSLSTLWYYGSDQDYHYFSHLWKSSTRYRIRHDEFSWKHDRTFSGYENGEHVEDELSRNLIAAQGIVLSDEVYPHQVLGILEVRPKDPAEQWKVDRRGDRIRIRKSRTDGRSFAPGSSVEFWRRDAERNWFPDKTA